MIQPPEDGAEEDAPPVIISKWIAHKTQKQTNMYEPTAEELLQREISSHDGQFKCVQQIIMYEYMNKNFILFVLDVNEGQGKVCFFVFFLNFISNSFT